MSVWQDVKRATKSPKDRWIAGVCGGLGAATPVPAWMWRVGFIAGAFLYGAGLILYGALWICMPRNSGGAGLGDSADGGLATPGGES